MEIVKDLPPNVYIRTPPNTPNTYNITITKHDHRSSLPLKHSYQFDLQLYTYHTREDVHSIPLVQLSVGSQRIFEICSTQSSSTQSLTYVIRFRIPSSRFQLGLFTVAIRMKKDQALISTVYSRPFRIKSNHPQYTINTRKGIRLQQIVHTLRAVEFSGNQHTCLLCHHTATQGHDTNRETRCPLLAFIHHPTKKRKHRL